MLFSVFTPTYNRADLLDRVFSSLMSQSFRDFEWIVLDDGSTDETQALLDEFEKDSFFPIKRITQENRGKVHSINNGVNSAKGALFVVFDSDDWCTENALECLAQAWNDLGTDRQDDYCGVSCLKAYQDESVVGEDYSKMDTFTESYVDRFNRRIKGDKWEILRTDLCKLIHYDIDLNEKYMAPEYVWLKMGQTKKTVFLNKVLSIVEYQADGISRNNLKHRVLSPISTARFYHLGFIVSKGAFNSAKSAVNNIRFSLHVPQRPTVGALPTILAFLPGCVLFLWDLWRLNSIRANR